MLYTLHKAKFICPSTSFLLLQSSKEACACFNSLHFDKVQIAKTDVGSDNSNLRRFQFHYNFESCLEKLKKLEEDGSENPLFVPIVDYLNVSISNPTNFFSQVESDVIALKISLLNEQRHNRSTYTEFNQKELVECLRNNHKFQNSLQSLFIYFRINKDFI